MESVRWGLKRFMVAVGSMARTRVVFVDKDFSEISAIKELLPSTDILLCQFHVIRHIKKEIAKLLLEVDGKNKLLSLFKSLLHSTTGVGLKILCEIYMYVSMDLGAKLEALRAGIRYRLDRLPGQ